MSGPWEDYAPAEKPRTTGKPEDFAAAYAPAAEHAGKILGVDPKIILGQWGLETGWGKSVIPGTNNLGNIKDFAGGGVAATDNQTGSRDKYRSYKSAKDFANDYADLILRKYPGALDAGSDPVKFAAGLKGYAEDPRYADKVVQASRMATPQNPLMRAGKAITDAIIPSANAAEAPRLTKVDYDPFATDQTAKDKLTKVGYDPFATEAKAPVEDPGILKTGLIAAGRGTDQIVKGVQQLYYRAKGDQPALDALAAESQANDEAYKPLQKLRPWSTGFGEALPDAALLAGGGGPAALLLRSTAAGAIPGALKYGTDDERLKRGLVGGAGGALGAVGGMAVNRVLSPAGVAGGAGQTVLDAAERIGYKPTAAQITQSPWLANLENYFSKSPGSTRLMQRASEANQTALNTSAAKAIGETASDVGETTLSAAKDRIGGEFSRLAQVTQPKLGDNFLNTLISIDTANAAKGPFANKAIDSLIDKGLDLASKGNLSGTAYKEIRTELGNASQTAFRGGDASAGKAYKDVIAALDDAAKGSLSAADQKAWDVARKEWAAYKTVTKGNIAEAGNISAANTAAALRGGKNGDKFRTGEMQGPLSDIGRIGEAFKGAKNPNSGNLIQTMLYGNPVTGIPMALGNRVFAEAYMSAPVQRYMAGGLLNIGKPGEFAISRGAGLLGAPAGLGLLRVE